MFKLYSLLVLVLFSENVIAMDLPGDKKKDEDKDKSSQIKPYNQDDSTTAPQLCIPRYFPDNSLPRLPESLWHVLDNLDLNTPSDLQQLSEEDFKEFRTLAREYHQLLYGNNQKTVLTFQNLNNNIVLCLGSEGYEINEDNISDDKEMFFALQQQASSEAIALTRKDNYQPIPFFNKDNKDNVTFDPQILQATLTAILSNTATQQHPSNSLHPEKRIFITLEPSLSGKPTETQDNNKHTEKSRLIQHSIPQIPQTAVVRAITRSATQQITNDTCSCCTLF